jgi:hypothetical protein
LTESAGPIRLRRRRMGVGERLTWLLEDYHRQVSELHARQAEDRQARMDPIDRVMAELDEVATDNLQ